MQSCLPWDTGKDQSLKNIIKLYALYKSPLLLYCRIWVIRDYTFTGYWSKPKQITNCQLFVTSFFCRHTDTLYPQCQQWNLLPSDICHIKILSHLQNCFKNSFRTTNKWFQILSSYLPALFTLTNPSLHFCAPMPAPVHVCVCVCACMRSCVLGDGNYM